MSEHDNEFNEGRLFHEGIELFNSGEWFEAHEVWEDIWHMASGQRKNFYQGLIQCSVTIEHISRGNPRGVRSVFASALTKFEGIPGEYMGLDVRAFLMEMKKFVGPVLSMPASAFRPELPRGQAMPVDWDHVPKIALKFDPFAV
jgi:predicted metal-dependent hydrolase